MKTVVSGQEFMISFIKGYCGINFCRDSARLDTDPQVAQTVDVPPEVFAAIECAIRSLNVVTESNWYKKAILEFVSEVDQEPDRS